MGPIGAIMLLGAGAATLALVARGRASHHVAEGNDEKPTPAPATQASDAKRTLGRASPTSVAPRAQSLPSSAYVPPYVQPYVPPAQLHVTPLSQPGDRKTMSGADDNLRSHNVQRWKAAVDGYLLGNITMRAHPVPGIYPLAWMAIESGGNACSVGEPMATVPATETDHSTGKVTTNPVWAVGLPREIGLFQIYNPDDFAAIGVKPADLVAYCQLPPPGHPNLGKQVLQMTPEQIAAQIDAGMKMIAQKRAIADHFLASNNFPWPDGSADYWRAVKLVHALPVIMNPGFSNVAHALGRPPATWAEFRTAYESINPRARYNAATAAAGHEQDGYYRALANAEWTGGQVQNAAPTTT